MTQSRYFNVPVGFPDSAQIDRVSRRLKADREGRELPLLSSPAPEQDWSDVNIRVAQGLKRHPKTIKLQHLLGIDAHTAIGLLIEFWCYCARYAQDGDLTHIAPESLCRGLEIEFPEREYTRLAHAFCYSLVEAGFIDMDPRSGQAEVHDWYDWTGKIFEYRERKRQDKRRERAGKPKEDDSPPDVFGLWLIHRTVKRRNRTMEFQAGYNDYKQWLAAEGYPETPTDKEFIGLLHRYGFTKTDRPTINGRKLTRYYGIGLRQG